MHAHSFACTGTVIRWEAYTSGTGSHPIQFQVWRDIFGIGRFQLVGNNTFLTAAPIDGILRLNVLPDERISVIAGDIVGVTTMEGNEGDPFKILTVCGTSTRYNLTQHFNAADGVLQLSSSVGVGCVRQVSSSSIFETNILNVIPFINAVLDGGE